MFADLLNAPESVKPNFKGGEGEFLSRAVMIGGAKFLRGVVPVGSSIGMHAHTDDCEVMFFVSGEGIMVMDGKEEKVHEGVCNYCPKGSSHSVVNTGDADLVFYAAVL
ncbi:MAG: cupin domain-containing protein [archaeon]|nr:cupin domain-containing protein [archaeon]